MKKFRKKVVCGLLVAVMAIGSNVTCYAGDYGIKFSENNYDAKYNFVGIEKVSGKDRSISTFLSEKGVCIGKTRCTLVRLRRKITNGKNKGKIYKTQNKEYEDVIVVKMDIEPQQSKKKNVYGVAEYLKCTISLPKKITTVNDYAPQNQPQDQIWTISVNGTGGIGAEGADGGLEVGASTQVKIKDIDVESNVNLSKKKAEFVYDYKPHKNISWNATVNKYVRNSSTQYAMISMDSLDYKQLEFKFNCNYTWAKSKAAKPINTKKGSQKGQKKIVWEIGD